MPLSIVLPLICVWPFSDIVLQAQPPRDTSASKLERTVDPNIKPGDNFFAYANGAWLKGATIPAGKDRWAVRDEINERARLQVAAILDDAPHARPGSLARKVADFRSAFLNQSAIEAKGIEPLKPQFARIDAVDDKLALTRLLGRSMRADVDPLNVGIFKSSSVLGLSVEHSIHGEKNYTAFLVQGGLGLGDRDAYLSKESRAIDQRERYQQYIARVLTFGGFDHAYQRAESVLALETALAETHATAAASANDRNANNEWSRSTFAHDAPGMDWTAFFEAAGLGKTQTVVAWQPTAVAGVASLVESMPLETWKDYLRFHAIDEFGEVLPFAFAEAAAGMRGVHATRDERAREQWSREITQTMMADAIGQLYVERYFSSKQKTRILGIIANVTREFRKHAANASWLSPESRKTAVAKIDNIYIGIGYPEKWESWNDLHIDVNDAFGNAQRIAERNSRHALARLTTPYDQREWALSSHSVGAVLNFQQNAYLFAAALLQTPKYDSTASDAATYGAIGAIIGHDMSHFVDVLGADYEPNGRMRRWWTAEDSTRFEVAAEPIVRQFSEYQPVPGVNMDGRLARTENVADLAGITAAFEAYRASLGARGGEKDYVRKNDREFFIAFAQAFATKTNEAGMRAQMVTDHAPEMYRMNTVRNIDAWYDAFDVVAGQSLYIEPKARVRIW